MNDWKETTLGQHLDVITDYHANGSYEILKKNVELKDTVDYAVMIRTTNFENDDFFVNLKYINRNGYEFLSKSKVIPSDILMNKIANAGSVYFMPNLNRPVSLAMNLFLLRTNKKTTNQRYIYEYLKFNEGYIKQFAIGTATVTITKQAVKNLKIILPPLEIQDKIAAILSAYDDLIENNKRRIALLENMAEEIYREWFVRFRFPNYKNAEFEKGIPKGWELVTLDKAFKCLGGGTPSKESNAYWKEGDINWYTPSDITGAEGFFLNSSKDKCNEEGLARSSAKMFPAYSIMMTSRATIGAIGINTTPACTNQGFITCIPNKKYPLTYLYYWFKLSKSHFVMLSGGATFPELSKTTFKRIEILTPSHEIIDEFDKIVKPIFEQVEKLLAMNESLKQSKNSLLPRLISGKLTVEKLNIQFPPSMVEAT